MSAFPAPKHELEEERLIAVREVSAASWPNDAVMESIARQAARACQAPLAMVSLMEEHEQCFLACVGRGLEPVDRDETFCTHAILHSEPMVVEDALEDPRFKSNPHVLGGMGVRFYVGAPILDGGLPLGTVCVVDTKPRRATSQHLFAIEHLSGRAAAVLRLRRFISEQGGPYAPSDRVRETLDTLNELLLPLVER